MNPGASALRRLRSLCVAVLGGSVACWGGRNYTVPGAPRYSAPLPVVGTERPPPSAIRIVTYNLAFARNVDGAITILREDPDLASADIILMQEMTAAATARIAEALAMAFVYFPAIHHTRTKQDFGNAVLARWPIAADEKVVLPHHSRYAGTQRTATMALVRIGPHDIRAYSTHLGTAADISGRQRLDQLTAIIAHAAGHACVIVGGDMNTSRLETATQAGFTWPTAALPRTTRFGRWDHLLLRGPGWSIGRAGASRSARTASDHSAVWVEVSLRATGVGPRACRDGERDESGLDT